MTEPFPPGLSIIHANHLEDLRDVAVEWMGRYPVAPLEKECFIVQSNGMAQWMKLALASDNGCGIGAGLDFLLPGRFMWQAYRAVLGDKSVPHASPFDRERLTWRLMRLLTQLGDDPVFSVLTRFLSDDEDSRKRYQLAFHLAALFDQYQVYRADWLIAWQNGRDALINGKGAWVELPREQAWQAALWRRIHEDISPELRFTGRADLHGRFLTAANSSECAFPGLPRRVIVFGICSLPAQVLEALDVLSAHCQILLFVHNPCRHYWADIIEDRELFKIEQARHTRAGKMPGDLDPDLLHQHVNPLLATWGKQGRDYIGLLYRYDQPETYQDRFSQIDLFRDIISPNGDIASPDSQDNGDNLNADNLDNPDNETKQGNGTSHARGTLLMQVQQNVLDLTALPASPDDKQKISPADRSIQFHLAHSRQREVEILQDQLLNLFEQLPDLRPRDVIVMTPDIDTYACHIQAVFGNVTMSDERFIPFSIADGPDNAYRPLLKALESLLNLPRIRMTTADIMALMEVPALGRRFGIKPVDLPILKLWIEGAGICWGLNSDHRKAFDLPSDLDHNTWDFGLRRMMLGYAVGNGFAWNGIEPYDEIGGLSAALVGGVTDFMNALEILWQTIVTPVSPEIWCQRIREMLSDFFMPGDSSEHLFLSHVNDVLVAWETACGSADFYSDLDLPVVRDHVMAAMTDSSTSQRFLAGKVNFCTMMPMRAIPFKVVCLLGMNDGEYPRSRVAMDFDLMAVKGLYRPGDRSRREDDRYLFLEALLSARNCLYISYIGHDVVDNSLKAPSVLVAQLRDYVSAGWRFDLEEDACRALTVAHPLQPFSKQYFADKENNAIFTYAREWREIFEQQDRSTNKGNGTSIPSSIVWDETFSGDQAPLLPLPVPQSNLDLRPLIQFMKNPLIFLFQQRLSIYFDAMDDTRTGEEPFVLEGLTPYILKQQLLDAGLAASPEGSDQEVQTVITAAQRLLNTGQLPMKGFGQLAMTSLADPVEEMVLHNKHLCKTWPHGVSARDLSFHINKGPLKGKILEGFLDGLHTSRGKASPFSVKSLARWEFYPQNLMDSKGNPSRLAPFTGVWIKHVLACAVGLSLTSSLVAPDGIVTLNPLGKNTASALFHDIIDLWWQGLCLPLPITPRTAMAWLLKAPESQGEEKPHDGENSLTGKTNGENATAFTMAKNDACKVYQGDGFRPGEMGYTPCALRAYPDFESLWQAHNNAFPTLAQRLYGPLFHALMNRS